MSKEIRKTRRRFTEDQKSQAVQRALVLMQNEKRSLYSTAKELGKWGTEVVRHSAIAYMMELWSGLTAFEGDPVIPLDNNHVERALRGPVITH